MNNLTRIVNNREYLLLSSIAKAAAFMLTSGYELSAYDEVGEIPPEDLEDHYFHYVDLLEQLLVETGVLVIEEPEQLEATTTDSKDKPKTAKIVEFKRKTITP